VSVGHVARLLEEGGIATVIIAVKAFRRVLESMTVPRAVITPYPMGRPIGFPRDVPRQKASLRAALHLLETAERPGSIIDLPIS